MIITCPRCFSTYNVPDSAFGVGGRMVRCSGCKFEWQEQPLPSEAIAGLAPEPDLPSPAPVPPPVQQVVTPTPVQAPAKPPLFKTEVKTAPKVSFLKKHGTVVAWLVFALATLASLLVLFREPIGKRSIAMTDFYENIGLPIEGPNEWFRFEGVQLEKSEADGRSVFLVHGTIINQSRRERAVPLLKLYWLARGGSMGPAMVLQAESTSLPQGDKTGFSGELRGVDASTGGEVKITFLTPTEAAVLKPGELKDPMFRPANPPGPHSLPPNNSEANHGSAPDQHATDHGAGDNPEPQPQTPARTGAEAPAGHATAQSENQSPAAVQSAPAGSDAAADAGEQPAH